jgi:hypothetical protein
VSLEGKEPQMSRQLELPLASRGEAPRVERSEEAPTATRGDERSGTSGLMELVCERQNLQAALKSHGVAAAALRASQASRQRIE